MVDTGGRGLGAEVRQKTPQMPIPLIPNYHLYKDALQFNNFPRMKSHPQKGTPQNCKKPPVSDQENEKNQYLLKPEDEGVTTCWKLSSPADGHEKPRGRWREFPAALIFHALTD